jgi:hypothetical protein
MSGANKNATDVEIIPIPKDNQACERRFKAKVKFRFSSEMASLKSQQQLDT